MVKLVLIVLPDPVSANPKMYFPLSVLYLGAVCRQEGLSCEIVDCRDGMKTLPQAEYYGFSCPTPQINQAKELAKQVKGKTIVGGGHATLLPYDCINYFDFVVVGEGEKVLPMILRGEIPKGIVESPRITDLDSLPLPAWDMASEPFSKTLFPGERYGEGELGMTITGSRGCPFQCAYCGNLHRLPVVYRKTENILIELEELIKRGVRYFRFEDDNFTLLPNFKRLCYGMKDLKIHYKAQTRSDLITPDFVDLMKLSGCEECSVGVESADDRVLLKNHKKETAYAHKKAIRILKEAGLRAKAYFMTGLPGETDETIEINKQFVIDTQIDRWTVSTFTPYPGCSVYKAPGRYEIEILNNDFSRWWNFNQNAYNHQIVGQTQEQMWARYQFFYKFLRSEVWKK